MGKRDYQKAEPSGRRQSSYRPRRKRTDRFLLAPSPHQPLRELLTVSSLFMKLLRLACLLLFAAQSLTAAPQLWLYCSQNLWVDKNIETLEGLFTRASKAGYTHVLLTDSKFGKLGEMDDRYFRNIERVKQLAATTHLEIVPALFPIGYSNDLLWHDPNLIEALPVRDALVVVNHGDAHLVPEQQSRLKGGDFTNLKDWDWHDDTVTSDEGAALIKDPKGRNARVSQKLKLTPFRQYHISLRIKTKD